MAEEVRDITPALAEDDNMPIIEGTVLPGVKFPMSDSEEAAWLETLKTDFKAKSDESLTAVVRSLQKVSVAAKLNNGTHDGKVQTVNESLPSLDINRYDDQKALNIIELLKPCLAKNVLQTQETKVSLLTAGD